MVKKPAKTKGIDPPMCKLCQTRHWSNEAHHFAPTKKKRKARGPGRRDG